MHAGALRLVTSPFCLCVHVCGSALHSEFDKDQPWARILLKKLKREGVFHFVTLCLCVHKALTKGFICLLLLLFPLHYHFCKYLCIKCDYFEETIRVIVVGSQINSLELSWCSALCCVPPGTPPGWMTSPPFRSLTRVHYSPSLSLWPSRGKLCHLSRSGFNSDPGHDNVAVWNFLLGTTVQQLVFIVIKFFRS